MPRSILLLPVLALALLAAPAPARACGGFFCTNVPVDQLGERIIFAVNEGAGTIDAYVQINYTGSPDQFAWVVPVPNPPTVDVAAIELFSELDRLTQPSYVAPPLPEDCVLPMPAAEGGVNVFGQGSVGPYDYAIVGSDDPQALVEWLRTNGYQITQAMEPLVDVYVREQMVFLAMKLQPQKETKDIQPIKMTYRSARPMIPLRLTAVAANPDMGVLTWIFAQAQAEPANYPAMRIADDALVFDVFGGHNYQALVSDEANRQGGRAFVTEYAGPTARLSASDPTLAALLRDHAYLTRVYTRISPEEMTVDPVFTFNPALPEVSNFHDLSKARRIWDCDANANRAATLAEVAIDRASGSWAGVALLVGLGALLLLGLGFGLGRMRRR